MPSRDRTYNKRQTHLVNYVYTWGMCCVKDTWFTNTVWRSSCLIITKQTEIVSTENVAGQSVKNVNVNPPRVNNDNDHALPNNVNIPARVNVPAQAAPKPNGQSNQGVIKQQPNMNKGKGS